MNIAVDPRKLPALAFERSARRAFRWAPTSSAATCCRV